MSVRLLANQPLSLVESLLRTPNDRNPTTVEVEIRCYSEGVREKGDDLDDRLKELMQELGNAINESLSDSDRIAGAIGEIKRAGYDVFLVLEATIGFNKRDESAEGDSDEVDTDAEGTQYESAGK